MNIENVRETIGRLGNKFDSHAFIRKFMERYAREYGELLVKHGSVTTANAEIANYLRINSSKLNISQVEEKVDSMDVLGNVTPNALWQKNTNGLNNSFSTFVIILLFTMISSAVFANDNDKVNRIGLRQPDNRVISYKEFVVDTLAAEKIYEKRKDSLLKALDEPVGRSYRCIELLKKKKGEKVTDDIDLKLLRCAYEFFMAKNPEVPRYYDKTYTLGFYIPIPIRIRRTYTDKNIKKGKMSDDVLCYLRYYYIFLDDSLRTEMSKIESGWETWVKKDELKYKEITVSVENPFYRGYYYDDSSVLDTLEEYQQRKGWEFLYSENRTQKHDTYPYDVKYFLYSAAPQYKVLYDENDDNIKSVYDKNGNLVYVPSLTRERNSAVLEDIRRLVYLKDYQNNKYNIKSQSTHTKDYLDLVLGKENGLNDARTALFSAAFGATVGASWATSLAAEAYSLSDAYRVRKEIKAGMNELASKYSDTAGSKYISQLVQDHAQEFGYVYIIERLSNVSFKVVYVNSQTLRPSYSAIITYRTGQKPFSTEYSTRLTENPKTIPPIERH